MNEDRLIDAIGMIDDAKIHEAKMVKRTKRWTAVLVVVVILITLAPVGFVWWLHSLFKTETYPYSLTHITSDISNSQVVHVKHSGNQKCYYIPDTLYDTLQLDTWVEVPAIDLSAEEERLILDFVGEELIFYDGYVYAEKVDWDRYVGIYKVPSGLAEDLVTCIENTEAAD